MPLKNKIYFVAIVIAYFVAVFFVLAGAAKAQETADGAMDREILIGPGKHYTNLTSVQPWIIDGELVGSVASYVYDDVTPTDLSIIGSFTIKTVICWDLAGSTSWGSREWLLMKGSRNTKTNLTELSLSL